MPDLGIRFAFGYWAPGHTAGAHEHTAWTITAVCRNELDVLTYHRDESYRTRELVPKNRFHAPAGRVGTICEPCIHEPRNLSADWSLSFHMTSPRDGERAGDGYEPLPALRRRRLPSPALKSHPYAKVVDARLRHRCIHQLARIVSGMRIARAPELLDRCYAAGAGATKVFIERVAGASPASVAKPGMLLVRIHDGLNMSCRRDGDMVALDAETPQGLVEQFALDEVAHEAIAFVVRERQFEVSAIPGGLTEDERTALADALEQLGLFRKVAS
jgi:hypothetical protein